MPLKTPRAFGPRETVIGSSLIALCYQRRRRGGRKALFKETNLCLPCTPLPLRPCFYDELCSVFFFFLR